MISMLGLTKQEQGIAMFLILGLVVGSIFELYRSYAGQADLPKVDQNLIARFEQEAEQPGPAGVAENQASAIAERGIQPSGLRKSNETKVQPSTTEAKKAVEVNDPRDKFLINLNTATQQELQKIPRIGPATAQKIIDFRLTNGAFTNVEQLTEVKGIGKSTLERIRPHVTVN